MEKLLNLYLFVPTALILLISWIKFRGIEYILIHYRWVFVCFFLLPLSVLYDSYFYLRSRLIFALNTAPEKHDERVKHVQEQVRILVLKETSMLSFIPSFTSFGDKTSRTWKSNLAQVAVALSFSEFTHALCDHCKVVFLFQIRRWNASGRPSKMCTARPGWQNISFRQGKYKKSLTNIEVNMMDILSVDEQNQTVRVEPLVSMGQITALLNPMGWTLPVLPELDDLTVGEHVLGCTTCTLPCAVIDNRISSLTVQPAIIQLNSS